MTTALWLRLIKNGKIIKDSTHPCTHEMWQEALQEMCEALDMQKPLILPKHQREFDQFSLTRFLPEHFMESVSFDRAEIEFIDPKKKKKNNEFY